MAIERTLSIIKPDATRRNLTGQVNARLEAAGLRIVAQKRLRLSRAQAEAFYAVHKERPFYKSLCDFMTSGPVVVQVLEGDMADAGHRRAICRRVAFMPQGLGKNLYPELSVRENIEFFGRLFDLDKLLTDPASR